MLHALLVWQSGAITLGGVVTYVGLMGMLRFPTFMSMWTFDLVQQAMAGARRILELINTETELDENPAGVTRPIQGQVTFEGVSFGYNGGNGKGVLKDISFSAQPGETIAIVGQTGSGKIDADPADQPHLRRRCGPGAGRRPGRARLEPGVAALADLGDRAGCIPLLALAGREHRLWRARAPASAEIERAAREAQAHEFITGFSDGYATEVGERGVTLSGGQRQRIAIARAFLTDPRILILDDSTSAIDSATEDQIQHAMRRIARERTTLHHHAPPQPDPLGRPHPGAAARRADRPGHARAN